MTTNRDSENQIKDYIKGCLRNDRQSQQALYKHFYGFAMGICLRYANSRLDASGILNDSFFKAFKNIGKYDPEKGFQPWLGKIVTNTAIDFYRANLKFAHHLDVDAMDHPPPIVTDYDNLAYTDLLKLIQNLSPAYRTVFNMFAIDGYSHEEIADILKISIGTSKSNLFKARQKLQEMLLKQDQLSYKIQSNNEEKNCIQVRLDTNR
ncbi:sigma-70 family RNA polymerase sigma factor [Pedobacter agri]|uniref:RNA polymerase sigma factor n=1 Tax=Pedobacter agri TaxID=454586 RepID=UPI00292D43FC|nr:sigma-70 family RNA polymerase sigma factor [Pedobacter agri]